MSSEQDTITAAKVIAANNLSDQLSLATALIRTSLGVYEGDEMKKDGMSLLHHDTLRNTAVNSETLETAYEEVFGEMFKEFSDFSSILNGMKSSWMPVEIYEAIEEISSTTINSEAIPDRQSLMESYENTFLRMLGMPSSNDIADCYGCLFDIDSEGNMSIENTNFNTDIGREFITSGLWGVLNKRQNSDFYRVRVGELYNFLAKSGDPLKTITEADMPVVEDIVARIKRVIEDGSESDISYITENTSSQGVSVALRQGSSFDDGFLAFKIMTEQLDSFRPAEGSELDSISNEAKQSLAYSALMGVERVPGTIDWIEHPKNFYKHCHLLFPPFQDGDIATCINEPSKIVAEPFLPESQRRINDNSIRSTLLEAVIRIRLDRLSGTTNFSGANTVTAYVGSSTSSLDFADLANSFGMLESLVLIRLWASVGGMAKYIRKKRPELKRNQYRTGYAARDGERRPTEGERVDPDPVPDRTYSLSSEKDILETAKLIEDSMMMFFGDNSVPAALALQADTQRTAGMKSAHLMSTVLSVVGANGQAISKRLAKIKEQNERSYAKNDDVVMGHISSILGVHKGVGIIDIVAFSIALFSMKEGSLLGLLNDSQYENLKKEFSEGFFDDFDSLDVTSGGRAPMVNAVNDVTLYVHGVYEYFMNRVKPPVGVHHNPRGGGPIDDEEEEEEEEGLVVLSGELGPTQ